MNRKRFWLIGAIRSSLSRGKNTLKWKQPQTLTSTSIWFQSQSLQWSYLSYPYILWTWLSLAKFYLIKSFWKARWDKLTRMLKLIMTIQLKISGLFKNKSWITLRIWQDSSLWTKKLMQILIQISFRTPWVENSVAQVSIQSQSSPIK